MQFIQSLVAQAGKFSSDSADMHTLARLAAERGEYELEHRLLLESGTLLRVARLMGTAAVRIAQKVRAASSSGAIQVKPQQERFSGVFNTSDIELSQPYLRALEDMENAVYVAEREAAERIVEYYRARLAEHRMAHHKVSIWYTGSSCGIEINGRRFYELQCDARWFKRHTPALDLLRNIERTIDLRLARYVKDKMLT